MSRFAEPQDPAFREMNTSLGFDQRLWPHDIAQSRAHAKMLAAQGIIGADDRDALLVEVGVQLLDLLLGDLHLLQAGFDLGEGQKSPFLTGRDQRPQLVELHNRSLVAQKNDLVSAHSP